MAKPTTLSAGKMLIMLGDGATPTEVFTAPCGLTTKGLSFSKETNDTTVPDCIDPDAASWTERVTTALSAEITGSGVMAKEALTTWNTYLNQTTSKNVRMRLDGGTGWAYWQGAFICTALNVTADLGSKVAVELTLVSDGPVTYSAIP